MALFIPQILVPIQLRTPGRDSPSHRLAGAVVEQALDDLRRGPVLAEAARWWFFDNPSMDWPSFGAICRAFGIDVSAARQAIARRQNIRRRPKFHAVHHRRPLHRGLRR